MAYSPYKMKGHTLPGIKQRTSPAKKELVGDQHNLPAELKAKIEAAPTKMYGKESPAKIIPGLGKTKYMDKIKAFGKAVAKGAKATDQGINKAIKTYKSEKKKARDSYKV